MDVHLSTRTAVDRRLLAALFCIWLIAHIDRSNVSFAALEMNRDLDISPTVYGLAAGVFFLGYAFGGIPHAAILSRFASHRWVAAMVGLWGLSCVLLAFTPNETIYVALRFLLGIGEAAIIPAAYSCLARFYVRRDLPSPMAKLASASTVAFLIGAPMAAVLLGLDWWGLAGWQWMFIVQGLPAVLLAPFVTRLVPYSPSAASWLSEQQKSWLIATVQEEDREHDRLAPDQPTGPFRAVVRRPVVWVLAAVYFCTNLGFWGLLFFLPQIVKSGFAGVSSSTAALIASIPYMVAFAAMITVGRTSARTGDQRRHLIALYAVCAVAMLGALHAIDPVVRLGTLTVGVACSMAAIGIYHSVTASALPADLRAMGVAVVNGLGLLGGFVGPYLFGLLSTTTGSQNAGFYCFAAAFAVGAVLVLFRPRAYPGTGRPTAATPTRHGGAEESGTVPTGSSQP